MNSQLMGATTDQDTAIQNVWRFSYKNLDPYKVKHWRTVWGSDSMPGGSSTYYPIDYEPEFMSLEEQVFEESRKFRDLDKGKWLAALSKGEGMLPTNLRNVSTARLNRRSKMDPALVGKLRRYLMKRDGVPVSRVLSELEQLAQNQRYLSAVEEEPAAIEESPQVRPGTPRAPVSRRKKTL